MHQNLGALIEKRSARQAPTDWDLHDGELLSQTQREEEKTSVEFVPGALKTTLSTLKLNLVSRELDDLGMRLDAWMKLRVHQIVLQQQTNHTSESLHV